VRLGEVEDVEVDVQVEAGRRRHDRPHRLREPPSFSGGRCIRSDARSRATSGGSKLLAPASTAALSRTGRAPGTVAGIPCHAPPVMTASPIPSK
jgi:hypothetical protein